MANDNVYHLNRYIQWAGSGLMSYQLHTNDVPECSIYETNKCRQGELNDPHIV